MLVVYCIFYLMGDFLRAFFYPSDNSSDAVGISVLFFFLSLWLLVNSIVYYRAFLEEMDIFHSSGGSMSHLVDGYGITSAHSELNRKLSLATDSRPTTPTTRQTTSTTPTSRPAPSPTVESIQSTTSDSITRMDGDNASAESTPTVLLPRLSQLHPKLSWKQTYHRWTRYLNTEVGIAYFLNFVGSLGYVISSVISLFLTLGTTYDARQIDKASLFIDSINMVVFIIDGALFWHVWWLEAGQEHRSKMLCSLHNWSNFLNTSSSVAYFAFIIYALNARYQLEREEWVHLAAGDTHWYDRQLIDVTFKQRTMYFAADIIYLIYAIMLEILERQSQSVEVKDMPLKEIA